MELSISISNRIFKRNKFLKANLDCILNVLSSCPHHNQQVSQDNGTNKTHHHWVVDEGGKEFSSAGYINHIGHYEERASKEGQMGT